MDTAVGGTDVKRVSNKMVLVKHCLHFLDVFKKETGVEIVYEEGTEVVPLAGAAPRAGLLNARHRCSVNGQNCPNPTGGMDSGVNFCLSAWKLLAICGAFAGIVAVT